MEVHKDHLDSEGLPLIFHLVHLAEQMTDEDSTVVALLHEVMEKGALTISDLRREGISEKDIEAISVLTYRGERQYIRYIRRIRENRIASLVKIADLKHDTDITRMDSISDENAKMIQKYEKALKVLTRKN